MRAPLPAPSIPDFSLPTPPSRLCDPAAMRVAALVALDSESRSEPKPSAAELTPASSLRSRPPSRRGRPLLAASAWRPERRSLAADAAIEPGPSTARTAGSFASSRCSRASAASRGAVVTAPLWATATISNGSVQPAPIDFATVSYCARAALPDGSDFAVGAPVFRPSTGIAASSRTAAATSPSSGRRAARRARLALTPPPAALAASRGRGTARRGRASRGRRGSRCSPPAARRR